MSTKATSKEEEGNLEHHWKTLNKEVEGPFLEPITFALTITTTLNH